MLISVLPVFPRKYLLVYVAIGFLVYLNASTTLHASKARVPDSWIAKRVEEARSRLKKTEAGKLIWASISYHGGLKEWFEQGPLKFQFKYQPKPKGFVRDSFQTIDTWRSRARHSTAGGLEFGWDGKNGWHTADSKFNPRFWSLTPFYFVGIPFVFADPGIRLSLEPDVELGGKSHHQVRVTYDANVGDSPDDFYVVLIEKETFKAAATRYIVSYKGFFQDGKTSPEKLMLFEGNSTVSGIKFYNTSKTYTWKPEWQKDGKIDLKAEAISAVAEVGQISFDHQLDSSFFDKPAAANYQEKL